MMGIHLELTRQEANWVMQRVEELYNWRLLDLAGYELAIKIAQHYKRGTYVSKS